MCAPLPLADPVLVHYLKPDTQYMCLQLCAPLHLSSRVKQYYAHACVAALYRGTVHCIGSLRSMSWACARFGNALIAACRRLVVDRREAWDMVWFPDAGVRHLRSVPGRRPGPHVVGPALLSDPANDGRRHLLHHRRLRRAVFHPGDLREGVKQGHWLKLEEGFLSLPCILVFTK